MTQIIVEILFLVSSMISLGANIYVFIIQGKILRKLEQEEAQYEALKKFDRD